MKKTALAIVAHPDDETIWMGGTILKSNFDWTIFSLCRKSDAERAAKFKKVCDIYKTKSVICDVEDEKLSPIKTEKIVSVIEKNLKQKKFDYIFTHGKNGEYGHRRHIELHKAIVLMLQQNILKCNKLYSFSYKPSNQNRLQSTSPKNSDMNIELNKKEHQMKQKIISEVYGFQKNSFEYLSSNKIESFRQLK